MITLKDLQGLHTLDAVDFGDEATPQYDGDTGISNVCRFRLNGAVYCAVEDDCDGYRSCMRELKHEPDAKMLNVFEPQQVVGVYRDSRDGTDADILELIDVGTGKVVLEVGTENTDDYYPSYISSFSPENMSVNAGAKP